MNRELLHRLKTAGAYQKKAIDALFPENIRKHLDVIEKEIGMILVETVEEWIKENKQKDIYKEAEEQEKESYMKKVKIE